MNLNLRRDQVVWTTTILVYVTLILTACKTSEQTVITDASVTDGAGDAQTPEPAYKMLPEGKGTIDVDYAILHQESGVYHPLELPPFTRRSGTRYSEDEVDFSFDYMTAENEGSLKATVYVYPNGLRPTDTFSSPEEQLAFTADHFEETIAAFPNYYSDFEVLDAKPISLETKTGELPWIMAEFRLVTNNTPSQERVSWTYLTTKGTWFIKYRISGPFDRLPEMRTLKDKFVTDFTARISD